jgi:hypothetical protein
MSEEWITTIGRHYGHLTSDSAEYHRRLPDLYGTTQNQPWTPVDVPWTLARGDIVTGGNKNRLNTGTF